MLLVYLCLVADWLAGISPSAWLAASIDFHVCQIGTRFFDVRMFWETGIFVYGTMVTVASICLPFVNRCGGFGRNRFG